MSLTGYLINFVILTFVVSGTIIFFLHRTLIRSTDSAVNRLNKETEAALIKQAELNKKLKEADEELERRRAEAREMVDKLRAKAEEETQEERDKIVNKARGEAEEIIEKAMGARDKIQKEIELKMDLKIIDFATQILGSVLPSKAKGEFDKQTMDDFVNELQHIEMDQLSPDIQTAELVTAEAMDDTLKKKVADLIQGKIGRPIQLENKVDPAVISGALLQFGSIQLDGTLLSEIREEAMKIKQKSEKAANIDT